MDNIVQALIEGDLIEFKKIVFKKLEEKIDRLCEERKKALVAEVIPEEYREAIMEKTFRIVNRIRGGKVQRRKKLSTRKGFTIRGGKMIRIKAAEMRRRKMGARRAARKRRSKKAQILRKRKRSLQRRKAMGFKPVKRK